jgi:uncharacterized protein
LSTYHPDHGIIVAAPFAQFCGSKFRDPLYVRSYRTLPIQYIQSAKNGFGLTFDNYTDEASIQFLKWNFVHFQFSIGNDIKVAYSVQVFDGGEVVQTAVITNHSESTTKLDYRLDLCISLNRASYGQLTEGGPIPIPDSRNLLRAPDGNSFQIVNPCLVAHIEGVLEIDDEIASLGKLDDQDQSGAPIAASCPGTLDVVPGSSRIMRARFRFLPNTDKKTSPFFPAIEDPTQYIELPRWKDENLVSTYILRRNVDYILSNCAVPVSETDVAIMTDHVALPLGWNRDN